MNRKVSVMAVIGSDINFDDVVKRVKDKGLFENIKFMGFLNGIDKFTVMKSSKICIFPSTYESFGMVVAEAMACGLPVVAYDLPVYREIYPVGMIKAIRAIVHEKKSVDEAYKIYEKEKK